MIKVISEKEIDIILKKQLFSLSSEKDDVVRKIVSDVSENGDKALVEYTKKFDKNEFSINELKVSKEEVEEARKKVDDKYLTSLTKAIENITAYHKKQEPDEWFETLPLDVVLGQRVIPLSKVGIYVPGGRAAYPSSVLMNAIPAKVAGVSDIIMVSPPDIKPEVLVAADEVGVSEIFRVGGAQAVAGLAFGTESVPQVDKIVGPGNIYVTLAKKMVFGLVGIDSLAGPSNVVIVADKDAQPEYIAADLLSQVEHDPSSFAVLITDTEKIAKEVEGEVSKQERKLKRREIIEEASIFIILVDKIRSAVDIVNKIAPEHLELLIGSPQRILEQIKNAGAVFLGPHSPVPVGDYIAGPNHVLPTGGTARFASPLGVYDFVKTQSIVGYTKPALKNVWKDIKMLAEIEGLDAHARAIDIRFY
jgi:histidinol dehydrogenase